MNLPFDLPAPAGYSEFPKWDGRNFVFDDQITPVLEYSENFAGWSDDLTALHEEAAGDSHPIDLASRKDALAQVKRYLPTTDAVIMEIGCSSGFLIRDLVKSFPESLVLGADVVKEPLYKLARDLPGVPLIRFDLLRCPLPDQSVDVLVMLNVLEHIEDDVTALKNVFKLLKPGGALVIEVPAGPRLYDSYDAELCHFRRYSASELKRKLNDAGFNVCRKSHLGFVLYPAFAAVKLLNKWLPSRRKKTLVRDQAVSTSSSALVNWAMKFESTYLSTFHLPFGIRTLAVAIRPK
jgi:SAM-dependent methyltransferase